MSLKNTLLGALNSPSLPVMKTVIPRRRTRDGRREMRLAFYKTTPDRMDADECSCCMKTTFCCCFCMGNTCYGREWWRDLVTWWVSVDGESYAHVEIMFSDDHVYSITQVGGVHYTRDRMLSNHGYDMFLKIALTDEQEDKIQAFAEKTYKEQPEFNQMGYYWNFLPGLRNFPLRRNGERFFCSEMITTALQEGGLVDNLDATTTSPTDLYFEVKDIAIRGYNRKLAETRIRLGEVETNEDAADRLLGINPSAKIKGRKKRSKSPKKTRELPRKQGSSLKAASRIVGSFRGKRSNTKIV